MSPQARVTLQVLASFALVAVVLWFMWRLPRRGESLYPWAPPLALLSAWTGLGSLAVTILLWMAPFPDLWLVVTFLGLYPASLAAGTLVLWIYRGALGTQDTIAAQLAQARVGIALGLLAVVLGYIYVMTHKTPFTAIGG